MSKFIWYLRERPELGILSSISGVLQTFLDTSTPLLQFMGLLIGVLIGLVTLVLKLRELFRKNNA